MLGHDLNGAINIRDNLLEPTEKGTKKTIYKVTKLQPTKKEVKRTMEKAMKTTIMILCEAWHPSHMLFTYTQDLRRVAYV